MSRVLIIISSENNTLEVVKSNLEREGYTVLTSKSGLDGIKMALVKSPDLIILDTTLSDIDVYKVCQELSNNPLTSLNPVIVLSASNKVEDKVLFWKNVLMTT
ncbi:response regulator [Peptococcaceae bacterium]|nr:response regulator [Peptococcaceae bacterium]